MSFVSYSFRLIDDFLSLITQWSDHIYPIKLVIKDISIETDRRLQTRSYQCDDNIFNCKLPISQQHHTICSIVRRLHILLDMLPSGMFKLYCSICTSVHFRQRTVRTELCYTQQNMTLRKFYNHHHALVDWNDMSVSEIIGDMFSQSSIVRHKKSRIIRIFTTVSYSWLWHLDCCRFSQRVMRA